MPSQSFQERNASFEHMYAPNRAKELFKRHKEIFDYASAMNNRLAWERKTKEHELQKNITMFRRRGDVLYQKLKEVEDRYFADFGKKEQLEEDDSDDGSDIYRPATVLGVHSSKRRISLDLRPRTSHPTLITTPKQPAANSRPPSATGSLPKSQGGSRPGSSSLKHRATTASGVRFAVEEDTNDDTYLGLKRLPVERPRSMSLQTDRFLQQRARRKSVFALTKAKQYELRNEGFKEDNVIFQEELNEKIHDFLERLDKYKEDYKNSLERKKEPPKLTDGSITSVDDISGHNNMSNKFKVKLANPYANTYSLNTPNPELLCKSNESMKSVTSPRSILHQKSETSIGASEEVFKSPPKPCEPAVSNLSSTSIGGTVESRSQLSLQTVTHTPKPHERSVSNLSSNSIGGAIDSRPHLSLQTITRTLSIASRVSTERDGKSKEDMMKERIKLLYLDAHGELEDTPECFEEKMKKQPKKLQKHQSDLLLNTEKVEEAFQEFMAGKRTPDDMKKLVAHTVKMKHQVRKRRDKSIVPFLAARRAARLWKSAAGVRRETEQSQP